MLPAFGAGFVLVAKRYADAPQIFRKNLPAGGEVMTERSIEVEQYGFVMIFRQQQLITSSLA
jgi:hypothetical protein